MVDFNTSDFVTAFQAGGYEKGPKIAVASVPEPTGAFVLWASIAVLYLRRKRIGFAVP